MSWVERSVVSLVGELGVVIQLPDSASNDEGKRKKRQANHVRQPFYDPDDKVQLNRPID